MAPRWRLATAHYLKVDGTEWEYTEVSRGTGKQIRKKFPVPQLFDPTDPSAWTHRLNNDDGDIVVTNDPTTDDTRDIVFHGDPTPDMIPLNDEAKAISATFANRWKHPIESLPGTYSQSLIDDFQRELAELQSQTRPAAAPVEGMQELLAAMAGMMKQNQQLLEALTKPPLVVAPETVRRV